MEQEVLVFTFQNPVFNTAHSTDKILLIEVVAFILGENLYNGPTTEFNYHGEMFDYLFGFLDPLDKHAAHVILAEIESRVEEISADYVYQSLITSGETFLKYDYQLGRKFTRLCIYPYGSE